MRCDPNTIICESDGDVRTFHGVPVVVVKREVQPGLRGDYYQVSFECPYCRSSYRADGRPRLRARHLTHYHGEDEHWDGSPTHRVAHCYGQTPFTEHGYWMVWLGWPGVREFT